LNNLSRFEQFYLKIKGNRWYFLFSIFCRFTLSYAFIVAGTTKIIGEKFASGLSALHPMGAYLEALHHTGYYYTFIGIAQVIAAILLLIPRTVALGALLYFPIIVNIWILSFALRFEGSFLTSPLMVFANMYLLFWNYDRLKYILPFKQFPNHKLFVKPEKYTKKIPFFFFTGVLTTIIFFIILEQFGYDAMPRIRLSDCIEQFKNTNNEAVGYGFCECVYTNGKPLDECLDEFEKAKK